MQSLPLINRLPTEVLGEIFTRCIPHPYGLEDIRYRDNPPEFPFPSTAYDAPLQLCSVCHEWREIALSMGSLWSQISVCVNDVRKPLEDWCDEPENWTRALVPRIETVSLSLQRSGQHPLWLSFLDDSSPTDSIDCDEESFSARFNSVFELFIAHAHHWHTMYFLIPNRSFPSGMYSIPECIAPMLSDVHVWLGDADPSEDWDEEMDEDANGQRADVKVVHAFSRLFMSSPVIRHLSWQLSYQILQHLPIVWDRLVEVSTSSMTLVDIAQLLQACTSLNELCIAETVVAPPDSPISLDALPHITQSHLQILEITTDLDVFGLGELYDKLTLPSLRHFAVTNERSAPQLLSLLSRSQCSLKQFYMHTPVITGDDLMALLQSPSAQSLTTFALYNSGIKITDELLRMLTPVDPTYNADGSLIESDRTSPSCICPLLQTLAWSPLRVEARRGYLSKMVASRQPRRQLTLSELERPAPLEYVAFGFENEEWDRFEIDRKRIDAMFAEGLKGELRNVGVWRYFENDVVNI